MVCAVNEGITQIYPLSCSQKGDIRSMIHAPSFLVRETLFLLGIVTDISIATCEMKNSCNVIAR